MIRSMSRLVALAASAAMVVAFAAPAHADPPSFADGAEAAVTKTDPALDPSENISQSARSDIDPGQKIEIDQAVFRGDNAVVSVLRGVGALREVDGTTPTGRIVNRSTIKRSKAGDREVLITDTSDRYGPGLLIASWTERDGVNYSVASRGALDVRELLRVVKDLPADSTTASRSARRAIKKAKPARTLPETVERSASSHYVDGAGNVNDDLNDEADLCSWCSYSSSNYVGFWQWILWADNRLADWQTDCVFGSTTSNATASWKTWQGLPNDGYVGYDTRRRAGAMIDGAGTYVTFLGINKTLSITRGASNRYSFKGAEVGYNFRSDAIC